jgi:hypothetical protein
MCVSASVSVSMRRAYCDKDSRTSWIGISGCKQHASQFCQPERQPWWRACSPSLFITKSCSTFWTQPQTKQVQWSSPELQTRGMQVRVACKMHDLPWPTSSFILGTAQQCRRRLKALLPARAENATWDSIWEISRCSTLPGALQLSLPARSWHGPSCIGLCCPPKADRFVCWEHRPQCHCGPRAGTLSNLGSPTVSVSVRIRSQTLTA